MGKVSAKNGLILIGGYSLSTFGYNYTIDHNREPLDCTGFGDTWRNYIPGPYSGRMAINMFWGAGTGEPFTAVGGLAAQCVTIAPEGYTLGNDCFSMYAQTANFTPGGGANEILTAGNIIFESKGTEGGPLPSQILANATITDTTTGTGFGDRFVGSGTLTKKCSGILHIYTACASDTYVVKIQHATTVGGAYADLVTFTLNGSAVGSELVQVASGSVREFRRVLATRTGVGQNFGFAVTFWRDY